MSFSLSNIDVHISIRRKPVAVRTGQINASRSIGLQKGSNNQWVDEIKIHKAEDPSGEELIWLPS